MKLRAIAVGFLLSCNGVFAEPSLTSADVVREVNKSAGICPHVGAGDGALSAELAKSGKLVVHGLERDTAKVSSARERLTKQGVYGQVALETWNSKTLPYADDL